MKTIEKTIVSILILLMLPVLAQQHASYPNSKIINHVIDWLLAFSIITAFLIFIYMNYVWNKESLEEK